jgi:Ca2+-binding EF-hand superfamily protein
MFDQDKSGNIGAEEIKKVLNLGKNPKLDIKLQKIIDKVDLDKNGEISFEEFEHMMTNAVEPEEQ